MRPHSATAARYRAWLSAERTVIPELMTGSRGRTFAKGGSAHRGETALGGARIQQCRWRWR
eukprot:12592382-Alexandrium_andersonii.AAC.1